MPQDTISNKFSSVIGITLLVIVLGFTVFINLFVKEPTEKVEEKETEIVETADPEFKILDATDLTNLWLLKNMQTDSMNINYDSKRTDIQINKNLEFEQHDSLLNSQEYTLEMYDKINTYKAIVNYGTLNFEHSFETRFAGTLEDVKIKTLNTNSIDSIRLMKIGNLFLDYQIHSISTESDIGNFTQIELKDGRKLFLMKEGAKIVDNYYEELLQNAQNLNDSTRIVYPY